ncbi:4-coumarate--CoA ligase [Spirosoma aureum]|uniref:4-coumarate--CoA ligase n=1 Tax=Spirosoma aureum TaxID=2692134 RepID=A0A6G9AU91_9BACT|nr:4-coumarate--CoA ligase [Spirosoma aureum]QIP15970.1 4-coumarate--CoA ligase [Spirosoma aureum]
MIWNSGNVQRIVLDMAGRILQQQHAGLPTKVSSALDLYRDLGMNSLQRMELAAHLNEFFGLFETSADNYLLASTRLDYWTNCILRARTEADDTLTFRTSGTSGQAAPVRHSMISLLAEAHYLAQLIPIPDQIISLVGANHIYGFIYTILLPALWSRPLRLLAEVTVADISANSLIIGTPFTWELLYQSLRKGASISCRGITSTATMLPDLFNQLNQADVFLTEIYGSTDTGGIAYRYHHEAPFALFPYITLLPDEPPTIVRSDTGASYYIPDRLERVTDRSIRLLGRFDESVSIAGVNVHLSHIRRVIEACPLVADCDVYAKSVSGRLDLYSAIRLRTHTESNREACLRWLRDRLSAPEMPKHVYLY